MAANAGNLGLRVVSAVILAPPVLAAVYFGGWAYALLVLLAVGLMTWEWSRLALGKFRLRDAPPVVLLPLALALFFLELTYPSLGVFAVALGFTIWRGWAAGALRFKWLLAGLVYLGLAGLAMLWLRAQPVDGLAVVAWLIAVVWATDIGAYAFGRLIGGPKLAPAISPKKTWAGLLGGMFSAAAVGWISISLGGVLNLSWSVLVLGSALLAVAAQAGDLFASLLKRRFGAKDASRLIPGHGGVLDRADGILAAAICVAGVLYLREAVF